MRSSSLMPEGCAGETNYCDQASDQEGEMTGVDIMFRKTTITLIMLALICSFPVFSYGESEKGAPVVTGSVKSTQSSEYLDYAASVTSKKVKRLPIRLKSNMESVTVKWKNKKNIKKYVVYRTDVTKDVLDLEADQTYTMPQYNKIGKVSGKRNSFKDKTAKKNHYYAYVVEAYKKVKGKYKLAYTSYNKDYYEYSCRGLGIPDLLNGGSGENYTNSKSCVYLYHQTYCGVNTSSVIVYRKAQGESKYKKINYKTVEKIRNLAGTIKDTTVKPGTVYQS